MPSIDQFHEWVETQSPMALREYTFAQAAWIEQAIRIAELVDALKWALATIDVSDWEDDIHMSEACGKYAWANHVLNKALANQPTESGENSLLLKASIALAKQAQKEGK